MGRSAVEPTAVPPPSDDTLLLAHGILVPQLGREPHDPHHLIAAAHSPVRLSLPTAHNGPIGHLALGARIPEPFGEMKRITGKPLAVLDPILIPEPVDLPPHTPPGGLPHHSLGSLLHSPLVGPGHLYEHVAMRLSRVEQIPSRGRHCPQSARTLRPSGHPSGKNPAPQRKPGVSTVLVSRRSRLLQPGQSSLQLSGLLTCRIISQIKGHHSSTRGRQRPAQKSRRCHRINRRRTEGRSVHCNQSDPSCGNRRRPQQHTSSASHVDFPAPESELLPSNAQTPS